MQLDRPPAVGAQNTTEIRKEKDWGWQPQGFSHSGGSRAVFLGMQVRQHRRPLCPHRAFLLPRVPGWHSALLRMWDPLPGPRPSGTHPAATSRPSVCALRAQKAPGPPSRPCPSPPHPGIWVRFQDFSTQGARGQNPKEAHSGAGHPVCRTWSIQVAGIICPYGHLGVPTVPRMGLASRNPEGGAMSSPFLVPPPKVDAPQGAGLNGNFSRCCSGYKGLRVPLPQQPLPPSVPCKPPPRGVGGGSRGGRAPYTKHRKEAQPSL